MNVPVGAWYQVNSGLVGPDRFAPPIYPRPVGVSNPEDPAMTEETMKVTLLENGPIKIEGVESFYDHDGTELPLREGKALFLCRCGASARRPFCDGTHKGNGFDGSCAVE